MKLWEDILDLIYPTICPGCGKVTERDTVWCEDCIRRIWNPRLINSSRSEHLDGCYTLCNYEGEIRECILQLKYNGKIERKKSFPPLLHRFPYWDRLKECTPVIPVPLSKAKMKTRGYNQVDMIFKEWMEKEGKTYLPHGLVRFRTAETQSLLSRRERKENIKGVFHVNHGIDLTGKTVLLVDDVYTTGATMESAAHELIRAGAEKVMGLTIASGAV